MASTCAPSLAANQWAWLKPHPQLLARARLSPLPYTIAAAAATAALVAAATAAAVTAGGPLLLPGRRPIFATKLP